MAALDEGGGLGWQGGLPWHLPEDLKHFKDLTWGQTILLGRRTFESMGRVLPGRKTLVLTREDTWKHPQVETVATWHEALEASEGHLWVAGGGQVYSWALPLVHSLVLTRVRGQHRADTFFPAYKEEEWAGQVVQGNSDFQVEVLQRRESLRYDVSS